MGVPWIKAKLDAGARGSALRAFDIEELPGDGGDRVRFRVWRTPLRSIPPVTQLGPAAPLFRVIWGADDVLDELDDLDDRIATAMRSAT